MEQSIQISCCYAHIDRPYLNHLKNHLSSIRRNYDVSLWSDTDISPGTTWEKEVKHNLDNAQIILLLVSADFLASEYCYSKEMVKALERHRVGQARVVPIIIRAADWTSTPIGELNALPLYGIPIESGTWHNQDDAFLEVTSGIRKLVQELLDSNTADSQSQEEYLTPLTHVSRVNMPYLLSKAVDILEESIDPHQRLLALRTLAEARHPVANEILARAVYHILRSVRIQAALLLAPDLRAIPGLLEGLYQPEKGIRTNAIEALAQIGEPAIDALFEALNNEDEDIQVQAKKALKSLVTGPPLSENCDTKLLQSLMRHRNDERFAVHSIAEDLLVKYGKSSIPTLLNALQTTNEKDKLISIGNILFRVALYVIPSFVSYLRVQGKPDLEVQLFDISANNSQNSQTYKERQLERRYNVTKELIRLGGKTDTPQRDQLFDLIFPFLSEEMLGLEAQE